MYPAGRSFVGREAGSAQQDGTPLRQKERFCLSLPGSARMILVCEKPPLLQNGTVIGGAHMRGRRGQGAAPVSGRINLEAVLQIGSLLYRKGGSIPHEYEEKAPEKLGIPAGGIFEK